jgi:hypothetical protein
MNGMTENRFVLDTNAVIFLTAKGNVIPSGLENELNDADLFISVISEIELFSKPGLPPIITFLISTGPAFGRRIYSDLTVILCLLLLKHLDLESYTSIAVSNPRGSGKGVFAYSCLS